MGNQVSAPGDNDLFIRHQVSAGQDHSNSSLHLTRPSSESKENYGNENHDEERMKRVRSNSKTKSKSSSKAHYRQSGSNDEKSETFATDSNAEVRDDIDHYFHLETYNNNTSSLDDMDSELDIGTDNENDDIETDNASSFAHFLSENDALSDYPSPPAMMSSRPNRASRSNRLVGNRSRANTLTMDNNNITVSLPNSGYNSAHSTHNNNNNNNNNNGNNNGRNIKDKPRRRSMVKNLHNPSELGTTLTTIVSNQEYVTPFSPRFGSNANGMTTNNNRKQSSKTRKFNYFSRNKSNNSNNNNNNNNNNNMYNNHEINSDYEKPSKKEKSRKEKKKKLRKFRKMRRKSKNKNKKRHNNNDNNSGSNSNVNITSKNYNNNNNNYRNVGGELKNLANISLNSIGNVSIGAAGEASSSHVHTHTASQSISNIENVFTHEFYLKYSNEVASKRGGGDSPVPLVGSKVSKNGKPSSKGTNKTNFRFKSGKSSKKSRRNNGLLVPNNNSNNSNNGSNNNNEVDGDAPKIKFGLRRVASMRNDLPKTMNQSANAIQIVHNFWRSEIDGLSRYELQQIAMIQYCWIFVHYPKYRVLLQKLAISNDHMNRNNNNNNNNGGGNEDEMIKQQSSIFSVSSLINLRGSSQTTTPAANNIDSNVNSYWTSMDYSPLLKFFDLLGYAHWLHATCFCQSGFCCDLFWFLLYFGYIFWLASSCTFRPLWSCVSCGVYAFCMV